MATSEEAREERTLAAETGFSLYAAVGVGMACALLGLGYLADYLMFWQPVDAWLAVTLALVGLGVSHTARCGQVWKNLSTALRKPDQDIDSKAQKALRFGLREPFGYFFLTLFVVTGLGLLGGMQGVPLLDEIDLTVHNGTETYNPAQLTVAGTALMIAFLPLAVLVYLEARLERETWAKRLGTDQPQTLETGRAGVKETHRRPDALLRDDSISVGGFYIPAVAIILICFLAAWAAKASVNDGGDEASSITEGLAFLITLAVIGVFLVFIVMPHVQRWLDNWHDRAVAGGDIAQGGIAGAGPVLSWETLPRAASVFDSILVRIVAPLTGVTQPGRGIPHLFVICTLVPVTALGFILPPPLGLLPIGIGILMVMALGRRWAWVEEDRDTASRLLKTKSADIHVGFRNDLKDEALLGYASLFVLVPLALYQINEVIPAFSMRATEESSNAFFAWISFFGAELAKAVPFVDWWEIYGVGIDVPVERVCSSTTAACPEGAMEHGFADAGKHLTFAARAIVDLVIMAALFQAIGIWQRSRAQEALYDSGQLDAFDPFLEEAFFKRGMKRAASGWVPTRKFDERVQKHIVKRTTHGLPQTPYNERRLTELLDHPDAEVRAGVEWMIDGQSILVGSPSRKLAQLTRQWQAAMAEHAPVAGRARHPSFEAEWRRAEKPRLEAVISELLGDDRESRPKSLTDADVVNLVRIAGYCGDHPEFLYARIEIVELLSQASSDTPKAMWALMAHACPKRQHYEAWTTRITEELNGAVDYAGANFPPVYFRWQEHRAICYTAIAELAAAYEEPSEALKPVLDFVQTRSLDEAKSHARPSAEAAFMTLLNMFGAKQQHRTHQPAEPLYPAEEAEEEDQEDA